MSRQNPNPRSVCKCHHLMGQDKYTGNNSHSQAYRHRIGRPYNSPSNDFGYTENFLYMLDRLSENNYVPNPQLARALDVIFILHADHELNCSTASMRQIASTGADPFICLSGMTGRINMAIWNDLLML